MLKPVEGKMDFVGMEEKWLNDWYKKGIVNKYLKKNRKAKKFFSFLDGPITANNPMGVHHAWGRTYKDLFPKFFNLLGFRQRFQNGFDCQGLWVEVEVEKELGLKTKKDIENLVPGNSKASIARFVELCKQRVYKFSKIQTDQSKRLGYFADWDHSYYTMSDENNYMIWYFLKTCHENGWIYKGRESVPWCPRCETAISQHEMLTEDYKEVTHESVYMEFKILNPKSQINPKFKSQNIKHKNEYLLVWTTTPWTLPANIAVAVDKDIEYSLVEGMSGDLFWVAKDLVEQVFKVNPSTSLRTSKVIKTVKGKELVGLKYSGPFDDLPAVAKAAKENPKNFHTVIPTDKNIMPISTTEGTGLVHTAVSAGTEDFKLGKKLGLPMIPVIADNADYLPGLGQFSGKNAKKSPRIILDFLQEEDKKGNDCVFSIFSYKHRYPACWRCKAELVWKVEDEWYIAMDVSPLRTQNSKLKTQNLKKNSQFVMRNSKINKLTLRERMIAVAKKIKWIPEFGLERELDWLKNMDDWLISKKNRYWGLALPIYECKKCKHFEVIGSKDELRKRAISGWEKFDGRSPHKPYIDEVKIKCQKCGNEVCRINDVGNPWLDAGIVPYSTIAENNQGKPLYQTDRKGWQQWFPADLITESFPGQFKNWFYAQIAMSTVLENTNPFKTVLGYATLTGEDGRPMHKSWGNMIEFNVGADKIGVDVMRWMYCRQTPSDNLPFGYKKADEVRRQFYLMLWNVYKFFVEYASLDKATKIFSQDQLASRRKPGPLAPCSSSESEGSLRRSLAQTTDFRKNFVSLSKSILDKWLINRFNWLVDFVEKSLKDYNIKDAALEIERFVNDLSLWYIRRSRDRVWVNSDDEKDKQAFYQTTYYVLVNLAIILSPFLPFISEEIYTNLTGKESVHLTDWPKISSKFKIQSSKLFNDMDLVRKIAEAGRRSRKELKLKLRQPLKEVSVELPKTVRFLETKNQSQYEQLLKEELNVKKIVFKTTGKGKEIFVGFDTKLTKELIEEGELRGLVREIQAGRKELGIRPDQKISLTIPKKFSQSVDYLKKKTVCGKINFGAPVKIEL